MAKIKRLNCVAAPLCLLQVFLIASHIACSQSASIQGKIISNNKPLEFANIVLTGSPFGASADSAGNYSIKNIQAGSFMLHVSCVGYMDVQKIISLKAGENIVLDFNLAKEETTLTEIVVTGVSKATEVRENPVAIASVSAKALEQTSAGNLIDALVKNVPGLNAIKTGPNISKPSIRGLGYNRVLVLYDGIRQEGQQWGDEHGIEMDEYNITKAEVIKGPASLMYGSDALAGVVSLFPYVPDDNDKKLHGKFISDYQANNNLFGDALRLGYSDKHFLFAVSGSYRFAKNYRNAVDGRVYNTNFNEKNFSTLIGYKRSTGYSHLSFTLYDDLQGIPDGSRDSLTRKFTKQISEGSNDDIKNRPIVSDDELNTYRLSPLHQHIQHYRIYTHHFYQIGNGNVDALLSFQQNIRREYSHPTVPAQPGMYVRLNTWNYGLRYNAPKFLNLETTIGINGMLQKNKSIDATDFPIPDYNLLDAGGYLYEKWQHNKWNISGGIRFDIRSVQWKNLYLRTDAATGFNEHVSFPDTANAILQFPGYRKMFNGTSASLGLTYELSKHISLKANIARGYRAPNITEMASNGLDPGAHIIYLGNKNFIPEFSWQEDIGAIMDIKNFSSSLSLFNNNIQNYIYLTQLTDANNNPITDQQGNKTYQYQQASAQLYGMESTFTIHPEKLNGFSFSNDLELIYGFNRKNDYKNKGRYGQFLPMIPPLKLKSSITQKKEIRSKFFSTLTAKAEMEWNAAQKRYLALNNTETYTPGYVLFNTGIIVEFKYRKDRAAQLQFQVNNLFDKVYQSNLNRLKYFEYYSQSPNGHLGMYNMGRNICLKMILPF